MILLRISIQKFLITFYFYLISSCYTLILCSCQCTISSSNILFIQYLMSSFVLPNPDEKIELKTNTYRFSLHISGKWFELLSFSLKPDILLQLRPGVHDILLYVHLLFPPVKSKICSFVFSRILTTAVILNLRSFACLYLLSQTQSANSLRSYYRISP